MAEIVACFTNNGVPLASPANTPTIRIRRTDTQVLVVTDAAMTEQGDGCFSFTFAAVDGLEYSIRADGDPTAAGQTTASERYAFGSLSGTTDARIEVDIPAILVDTGTSLPAQIAALNDLSIADVQQAMTNQGYTPARATNLDNLDAAISSVLAAISALNDISVADILSAALSSGDTVDQALSRLDNIDVAVTGLVTATITDSFTVGVGSSPTEVRTNATQADDYFDGQTLVVVPASGTPVGRPVQAYTQTNGAFSVRALPFTPASGDTVFLVARDAFETFQAAEKVRKVTTNRVVVNPTDTQIDVYEDDGTTIAFSFTVSGDRRTRTPI